MLTYTFRSQLPLGRIFCFFFFNDTATTEIYTLSLHDALPISSLYDGVMKELEKEAGIKPLQVWWTVTHTHSAPEIGPPGLPAVFMGERYEHDHDTAYTTQATKTLIAAIKEARAKLEPARLGVGWGVAPANINRR